MHREHKYALVTGCGKGGIGEALVKRYAACGVRPIATILPWEPGDHLTEAGIICFPLDVTVEESVATLKRNVQTLTEGHLDVLVNNAGICYTMTAIDTDVDSVKKMFDVNLFGPMRMVHHFHDMLIHSAGAVINIGSIGGIVPYVYGSSYNASKAALQHWSNTLRLELSPFKVRVITVISGEVGTNILMSDAHRELPEGSFYSPMAADFKEHVQRTPASTTDRYEYAAKVVAISLKKSPPAWFWYGSATGVIRFFDMFAPRTFFDFIFFRTFNLAKLRDAYFTNKKDF